MVNIFLVKSPLQLLNAIEARHYFGLDDNDCVLIIMGDRKSYPQMLSLAKIHHQWSAIVFLNAVNPFFNNPFAIDYIGAENSNKSIVKLFRSSFFSIWQLTRLAKYLDKVERIFVGDINQLYMRHFINRVMPGSTILLDDGTATVEVARKRKGGLNNQRPKKLTKRIKLAAKRFFQGLNDKYPQAVSFFSSYDVQGGEHDELIKNNFNYLRKEMQLLEMIDCVYFLGAPLCEAGIMEKQDYLEQVKKAKAYFKDKDFIYISHRREDGKKLEQIQNELNVEVCLFDYPIEYQLAMIGPRPTVVASFVSSALENLRLIMGDQIKIISFRLDEGTYKDKARVDSVYAYYANNISDYFMIKSYEN